MRRIAWLPHPLATLILALVWLMLNNTVAFAHIVLGVFLGILIPWMTRVFWPETLSLRHPLVAFKLTCTVIYDIVVANLIVARLIIGPVPALRPAFVGYPLQLQTSHAISTLASIITLTPGTVSARLSQDRRVLLIHVLDLDNAADLIAEIRQRYEAPLKEIFEC